MRQNRLHTERGMAALIALILVAMLTLLGLAAMSTSDDDVTIAGNELQEVRAFYAAEAGLEQAAALLQTEYDSTGLPPVIMPTGSETINGCAVTFSTVDGGPAAQQVLTSGTLAGLHALVKSFGISSTAVSPVDNVKMEVSQTFETALVPIFQFAVFYENDLWATPAYETHVTGRVHVNGNMYIQACVALYFDGNVTSAGGIYHGFPDG
ncbi:MAG: pilus assembly PilX N-terminal domain-containing protein, partial [Candidatus Zixiibacteriota bacterium]